MLVARTKACNKQQFPDAVQNLLGFANRRIKLAQRPTKERLSQDEYRARREALDTSGPLPPKRSDATKDNISSIREKFIKYCERNGEEDWHSVVQNCTKGTTMMFLHFLCEDGRINTESSIHQYLLQFKQLYNDVNGRLMDSNDAKQALIYLQVELPKDFPLSKILKPKPVLGTDDVLLLLTHHWARDTSIFPTEDQRLRCATVMLFSLFTGCRPAELVDGSKRKSAQQSRPVGDDVIDANATHDGDDDDDAENLDEIDNSDDPDYDRQDPWDDPNDNEYVEDNSNPSTARRCKALCYEYVRLWIVKNPTPGERDVLGMEITLAHHKGADRKPKPTTYIFREDPLPILCPISHMLAIAIKDDAIEVNGYSCAEPFFETNLQSPTKAMLVHWKPEMLKVPIFRQAVRTATGFVTSESKAMRYSTYAYYLQRLGWATGFEQKLTCYCFRRGTGNAVDGAATAAVRDQIMRHNPNSGVFSGSYINEKVRFIIQDAVLDRPTDVGFLRAFTHMSLTCDPRAPQKVPQEVLDTLPPDPEIVELETQRVELSSQIKTMYKYIVRATGTAIAKQYQQLVGKIASLKKCRDEHFKIEYRRDYFYRTHNDEMERQLKKTATDKYVEPVVKHQLPERTQLQEVICDLSEDLTTPDIVGRRIRSINLTVALSRKQEVQHRKPHSTKTSIISSKELLPTPQLFPMICEKTQCIICIGDERLSYEDRTRRFSRPEKMKNHVDGHLKWHPAHERFFCHHPECVKNKLVLKNLELFKLHVAKVHKICLRP